MFEIRVEHTFPAGHHLRDYEGPCANPHGHNYRVQVAIVSPGLNEVGLLMDFSDLKKGLRAVAEELDHAYLNDLPGFAERNPSAENIALYVYEQMAPQLEGKLPPGARILEVVVQETDTAWAVYRPDSYPTGA
jgi:6-pyruvoyltetrahydropterin/6-carboxytetrahydropterin synthase